MNAMFLFLAALTLAGAIASMTLRNPVHCALSLVVTFAGLAGVYLGLGAQFLGLAQVLVYIGAVAILLLFVLLVTRSGAAGESERESSREPCWMPWGTALVAGGFLAAAVWTAKELPERAVPELRTVRQLGESLMTDFVVPLQVVGVLLTAAMIGAAIIALRERKPRDGESGEVRR